MDKGFCAQMCLGNTIDRHTYTHTVSDLFVVSLLKALRSPAVNKLFILVELGISHIYLTLNLFKIITLLTFPGTRALWKTRIQDVLWAVPLLGQWPLQSSQVLWVLEAMTAESHHPGLVSRPYLSPVLPPFLHFT